AASSHAPTTNSAHRCELTGRIINTPRDPTERPEFSPHAPDFPDSPSTSSGVQASACRSSRTSRQTPVRSHDADASDPMRMDPAPRELVIRSQHRDAAAFAALIDRHERTALSVAYGVLAPDASGAGDAAQE